MSLCVLCVSVVEIFEEASHHRAAEDSQSHREIRNQYIIETRSKIRTLLPRTERVRFDLHHNPKPITQYFEVFPFVFDRTFSAYAVFRDDETHVAERDATVRREPRTNSLLGEV